MTIFSQKSPRIEDVLAAAHVGENDDWEFKFAKGGFPGSLWETYSAFANSTGGVIVLGVTEKNGGVSLDGLDATQIGKCTKTLWDSLNDRGVVNRNILASADVTTASVAGGELLLIRVPQAVRKERPVYKGQNPFGGTYKRRHEGDYKCSDEEVRRMFTDANDAPADSRILEGFSLSDLDEASVRGFRNRFASTRPDHVWLGMDDEKLLEMMGAIRTDRETNRSGVTLAGVLMFGKHQAIISPGAAPSYFVDFRDYRGTQRAGDRWTDRLYPDGTWEGNLYQFYTRVWPKLVADLKVPFALSSGQRVDASPVQVALREAVVNALVHTDYAVGGGIVVERRDEGYQISNPGTLLVTGEQLRKGGVSECRNKTLQRMFINIGAGDQAGSGFERIQAGWRTQHWRAPQLTTQDTPDRVILSMPMAALIPHETMIALRHRMGAAKFDRLSIEERAALATAALEGTISNARLQELITDHPADITKLLRGLVNANFLEPDNQGRWTRYTLAPSLTPTAGSGRSPDELGLDELLSEIKSQKSRPKRELVEAAIIRLCNGNYRTAKEIANAMSRKSVPRLRENYLTPMVVSGKLIRLHEEYDNPEQAYRSSGT